MMEETKLKPTGTIIDKFEDHFERASYGIAESGKGARILIDTIYTDKKSAPIRELWSNCYDSHVAAGVPLKPFDCHLPTIDEPWVSVRDYGVSMTHNFVMENYTKLFDSSKEEKLGEVGQFGLGSKTPFAYTDNFIVEVFLHGRKRKYLSSMTDGMPEHMFLGEGPSSEPQGVLVQFPVELHDIDEFIEVAAQVARGFDVLPNFVGDAQPDIPIPLFSGKGWKVYAEGGRAVRMGCVIYPVTQQQLYIPSKIRDEYGFVFDMPIGSVQPTANREALSFDPATKQRTVEGYTAAADDFREQASRSVKQATNIVEAQRSFISWRKVFEPRSMPEVVFNDGIEDHKLNGWIDLKGDGAIPKIHTIKGDTPFEPKFNCEQLAELMFIIDKRDRTVPRRARRIKQYRDDFQNQHYNYASRLFVLPDATPAQVSYLKQRLCLTNDQFIKVEDTPDVAPAANAGGKRTGIYTADYKGMSKWEEDTPADFYWVSIEKGNAAYIRLGQFGSFRTRHGNAATRMEQLRLTIGANLIPEKPIIFLTPQAQKRLNADDSNNFAKVCEAAMNTRKAEFLPLAKAKGVLTAIPYGSLLRRVPRSEWNLLFAGLGIDWTDKKFEDPQLPESASKVLGVEIEDNKTLGKAAVAGVIKKYPLLGDKPERSAIVQYLDQTRKANAAVPVQAH